jgi:hypothetical protein
METENPIIVHTVPWGSGTVTATCGQALGIITHGYRHSGRYGAPKLTPDTSDAAVCGHCLAAVS